MEGKDPAISNAFSRVHKHISEVERKLEKARQDIDDSAGKKELEKLSERLEDLREKIRPLQGETALIEELKAKLSKLENDSTRRAEYLDVYTAVAKIQKELSKREDLKKHLIAMEKLGSKLDLEMKRSDRLEKGFDDLRSGKADNDSISFLRSEIEKKKVSQEELKKGLLSLEEGILRQVKDETGLIQEDIRKITKAIAEQDKDIDSYYARLKELDESSFKINDARKELRAFEKEMEKLLKDRLKDADKEILRLKESTKDAHTMLDRLPEIEKKISGIEAELSNVNRISEGLDEIKVKLSGKADSVKLKELKEWITEKEKEIRKELKSEIQKLSKGLDNSITASEEYERELKESVMSSVKELNERFEDKAEKSDLLELKESLHSKENSLRKELKNERDKLLKDIVKIRQELDSVESGLKERSLESISELRSRLEDAVEAKKKVEVLDTTFQRALEDLNRHEGMIRELEDSVHSQTKSFDIVNTRLKSMVADYDKNLRLVETKVKAHADVAVKSEMVKFGRTVEGLRSEILTQRQLIRDKAELEKRLKAYRDERIERWRTILISLFLGIGAFTALLYYYRSRNPIAFPGLGGKLVFILIILGILVILTFLNYDKIFPMIDSFFFRKAEKKISSKEVSPIKMAVPGKVQPSKRDVKAKPKKVTKKGFLDRIVDFFDED